MTSVPDNVQLVPPVEPAAVPAENEQSDLSEAEAQVLGSVMCDDEIWQLFKFNEPAPPPEPEVVDPSTMTEEQYVLYRKQMMERLLTLYRDQFSRLRDILAIKHRAFSKLKKRKEDGSVTVVGLNSMPGGGTGLDSRPVVPLTVDERRKLSMRDAALASYECHQLSLRTRQRRVRRRGEDDVDDMFVESVPAATPGVPAEPAAPRPPTPPVYGPIIDIKPVPASIIQCILPSNAHLLPPLCTHCEHSEEGLVCDKPPLPLTHFCMQHILDDPKQRLWHQCTYENCRNPCLLSVKFCDTHSQLPPTATQVGGADVTDLLRLTNTIQ